MRLTRHPQSAAIWLQYIHDLIGSELIILLADGDKSCQTGDITFE